MLDKYSRLDKVIKVHGRQPGQLIHILHQAQEIFGYLSPEVQAYLAARLNIPLAEIAGVVSFYSLFNSEPKGKYTISVCLGTACYVKGSQEIFQAFKNEMDLDDDDTTPDGLFTLRSTRCMGACGLAPVMAINDDIYGQVTAGEVAGILSRYQAKELADDHVHQRPAEHPATAPPPH
ncbi:NADH-quinone oxidoreductase subunit E-like [Moorella glycerini]|uniref:NADP-reducing hydrogenase subunit HndA n=1 Tax=Neomoorella stamsii TaxID=1266720 RepID=A0A9X7P585_9FIRM|nr:MULTISPECIES: NAD(P)H-dependent oxidoreductase subunit E [Moorella]PRR70392.1 NADP-reducing hydrogenase subunit HndA [Moorella stamsii]CEP66397.1 NADH-quinone oxidoreductase subunit E-like [Moorella glycerini]